MTTTDKAARSERTRITGKYIDKLSASRETDHLVGKALGVWPPPFYSSREGDAWGAVEVFAKRRKMHACVRTPFDTRRRDPRMDDDEDHSHPSFPLYWAGFTPMGATGWNGRDDWRASGETMPLAVCRAILRAVHCKPQL